jgi:NRAMP (natural resistance-associated macrophage protein)-like metal ion transporter
LGPGLITGASDDDPAGIATYAVAGATLGYSTLWTAVITLPLMQAVELTCARIGLISGTGLTGALKGHYPRPLVYVACAALLVANVFNIGADLAGMADAAEMLTGISSLFFVMVFAAVVVIFTARAHYATFARYIKLATLALFAYIAVAIAVRPPWREVLGATFLPQWRTDQQCVTTVLAILGTTISPYLFFWQASHEVEAEKELGRRTVRARRGATMGELADARADVLTGMCLSNVVFYFIVLATASTLYRAGQHDIETTRQAAEALRPLAGSAAYLLFSIGLVGRACWRYLYWQGQRRSRSPSSSAGARVSICVFDKPAASTRCSAWRLRSDSSWTCSGSIPFECCFYQRWSTDSSRPRFWCWSCSLQTTGRSWVIRRTGSCSTCSAGPRWQ